MTSLELRPSVDVQRQRFGILVRQARTTAGLTQTAIGGQLGWHQSDINDIEHGRRGTKKVDLERIVDALDIDPVTAAHMRVLSQRETPPCLRSDSRLTSLTSLSAIVEREFVQMFNWSGERIALLLQSEHYMLAQFHTAGAATVTAPIAQRQALQEIFTSDPNRNFEFLLSESALDRLEASVHPAITLDQIDHMLDLMRRYPSIKIRLVPYKSAADVDPGYTMLRFSDAVSLTYSDSVAGLVPNPHDHLPLHEQSREALQFLARSPAETAEAFSARRRRISGARPAQLI